MPHGLDLQAQYLRFPKVLVPFSLICKSESAVAALVMADDQAEAVMQSSEEVSGQRKQSRLQCGASLLTRKQTRSTPVPWLRTSCRVIGYSPELCELDNSDFPGLVPSSGALGCRVTWSQPLPHTHHFSVTDFLLSVWFWLSQGMISFSFSLLILLEK